MKTVVGCSVHYVSFGSPLLPDGTQKYKSLCRAAVVSEVGTDGQVGLVALNPTGLFFHSLGDGGSPFDDGLVPYDDHIVTEDRRRPYEGGSWHLPTECNS